MPTAPVPTLKKSIGQVDLDKGMGKPFPMNPPAGGFGGLFGAGGKFGEGAFGRP